MPEEKEMLEMGRRSLAHIFAKAATLVCVLAVLAVPLASLSACSGTDSRRAAVVGLRLDLEGLSDENIAAVTAGDSSVISALRARLADTYGTGTDFDIYYSRTNPEDGSKEYVLSKVDAAEDNADASP